MGQRLLFLMLAAAAGQAKAEVIDRVVGSAGLDVVTLSEARRYLEYQSVFQNRDLDLSRQAYREAVDQLLNQTLIRREIEISRYTPPAMAEAEARLNEWLVDPERGVKIRKQLAAYGITEDDLRRRLLWYITVMRFTDYRFSPGVQIRDQDVEEYYKSTYLPEFRRRTPGKPDPTLEESWPSIQRLLVAEKATQATNAWLDTAREQAKVRIYEEALP
jgi:hypothetical protein